MSEQRDIAQEHLRIDKWVEWAINDGMAEPFLSNLQSWTQQQILALAEQIHDEKIEAVPDPNAYPETVGFAEQLNLSLRQRAKTDNMTFQEICLATYQIYVQKFVLNFRPEELHGRSWRELRRTKGPLRLWC